MTEAHFKASLMRNTIRQSRRHHRTASFVQETNSHSMSESTKTIILRAQLYLLLAMLKLYSFFLFEAWCYKVQDRSTVNSRTLDKLGTRNTNMGLFF